MLLPILALFASCKVGKQPVRRQVKIIDSSKMKRYGLVTVDTPGAKPAVKPEVVIKSPTPESGVSTEKQTLINTLSPLWQKSTSFSTFSGKAKMHYAGTGQKQEFTANIRIQKDKIIWVNVTALGGIVNVARVYITPDSIFLINYLQREAYKMHISQANKLLPAPVNFRIMQNLILGDALTQAGQPLDASDFGGTLSIETEDGGIRQLLSYNKTDSTMRSLQMRTRDNQTEGMIQYGNYDMVSGHRFATSRAINLSNNGEPYYLDMNFNTAEFDLPTDFPFTIPKNYTLK